MSTEQTIMGHADVTNKKLGWLLESDVNHEISDIAASKCECRTVNLKFPHCQRNNKKEGSDMHQLGHNPCQSRLAPISTNGMNAAILSIKFWECL